MKIALIDSGIDEDKLCKRTAIIKRIDFCCLPEKESRMNLHGTNCANIIAEQCSDVEFWDLKVLDEKGSAPIYRLLDALDWCIANKVRLLHMSLGTRNYFDVKELEGRIARLTKGGTIIVAAYHNSNMRTYPAVFSRVFGVRQDMSGILGQGEVLFQKIKGLEEENSIVIHWWKENLDCANSYAAPVLTGMIADYLNQYPDKGFDETLQYLKQKANSKKQYPEEVGRLLRTVQEQLHIPVILAADLNPADIHELAEAFRTRGYFCIVLQEQVTEGTGIPWGFYVDKQNELESVCITIQKIYQPDILILDTVLENFYNENQDIADICLKKKDEKYYLSGERLEEMFCSIKNTIETIFLYFTGA